MVWPFINRVIYAVTYNEDYVLEILKKGLETEAQGISDAEVKEVRDAIRETWIDQYKSFGEDIFSE